MYFRHTGSLDLNELIATGETYTVYSCLELLMVIEKVGTICRDVFFYLTTQMYHITFINQLHVCINHFENFSSRKPPLMAQLLK